MLLSKKAASLTGGWKLSINKSGGVTPAGNANRYPFYKSKNRVNLYPLFLTDFTFLRSNSVQYRCRIIAQSRLIPFLLCRRPLRCFGNAAPVP